MVTEKEITDALATEIWIRLVRVEEFTGGLMDAIHAWEERFAPASYFDEDEYPIPDSGEIASAYAEWLVGIETPKEASTEVRKWMRRVHDDFPAVFEEDVADLVEEGRQEGDAFDEAIGTWGEVVVYNAYEGFREERLDSMLDATHRLTKAFMPDYLRMNYPGIM